MSSVESYKKALTNLVDGQRRLTAELQRMKAVNEEQEKELMAARRTVSLVKTRVSQFAQFLRSTPLLVAVYKTAEFARLCSEGDFTLTETPKITAELSEFYQCALGHVDGGSGRSNLPRALSPGSQCSPLSRTVSPPIINGNGAACSAECSSLSAGLVNALVGPDDDAPQAVEEPVRPNFGAVEKAMEIRRRSIGSGRDSPTPAGSPVLVAGHNVHRTPATTSVDHGAQCELLLASTTPTANLPVPSNFLDRALPTYLTALSPALKADAEEHYHRMQSASIPGEGDVKVAQLEASLKHTQQQLAIARSTVVSIRARLEDVLFKYQRVAAQAAASLSRGGNGYAAMTSSSVFDHVDVPHLPCNEPLAASLPPLFPSTPRPPTQSRASLLMSRGGVRAAHKQHEDEGANSPPNNNDHQHLSSSSSVLSYFVEDVCTLLRDARAMLSDLDMIHWRLASHHQHGGEDEVSSRPEQLWRGRSRQNGRTHKFNSSNKVEPSAASHNNNNNSTDGEKQHPFRTCAPHVLARIAELLTASLKAAGHDAPRFSTIHQTTMRHPSKRTGGKHCRRDDIEDIHEMLQRCWTMLVSFLDAQVHHAQTKVFIREPKLDEWMRQSPPLASLVKAASAPDPKMDESLM